MSGDAERTGKGRRILSAYCAPRDAETLRQEDVAVLTHMVLSAGVVEGGTTGLRIPEGWEPVRGWKRWNPDLKVLLGFDGEFSGPCRTPEGRRNLADGMAGLVLRLGYDGVDIDWEYPCSGVKGREAHPEDHWNSTDLFREVRAALDRLDEPRRALTTTAGAGRFYLESTEMDLVHPLVDHVHLLTFDMRGEHQVLTGHQSNLFLATGDIFSVSADIAARGLVAAGVPRSKVVFGFAQRSRRWDGVPDRYRGHLQIARTIGRVGPTYGELAEGAFERNGFFRHWDDECQVPFLFDGKTFLSYDDERSVSAKAAHVREQGYGGLFCRDPGCDRSGALLGAAFRGLEDR